jgi:hypothetical protein
MRGRPTTAGFRDRHGPWDNDASAPLHLHNLHALINRFSTTKPPMRFDLQVVTATPLALPAKLSCPPSRGRRIPASVRSADVSPPDKPPGGARGRSLRRRPAAHAADAPKRGLLADSSAGPTRGRAGWGPSERSGRWRSRRGREGECECGRLLVTRDGTGFVVFTNHR